MHHAVAPTRNVSGYSSHPYQVKGFSVSTPPSAPVGRGHHLLSAVGTISFYTLLSRILGFARDVVIARGFGSGMDADAFFVAQKLPNFLRRLFAEGAFATAFVPVFSTYKVQGDAAATREMVMVVFTALAAILMVVVALGELAMPLLLMVIAPGFGDDPEKYRLTVDLTRITFPYILLISLVAMAGGVLNSFRRFAVPAATPILLNVFIILGAVYAAPWFERPSIGLALGILIGGVVQLLVQFPAMARLGMPLGLRWNPRHPAIRRILTLMGPSVLGVSVAQISLILDTFLASWLPVGSISYLYYADRLVEFPLGLIGIAMATAILPALSAKAARGDEKGLNADLEFALRVVALINVPASVALVVLREPILVMLFQGGAFNAQTTEATSQALLAYSCGLMAFTGVKVVAPAFFARHDTRTPVRVAIVCLLINMVLNVILMFPLKHVGLALATTLTSYLNVTLLLFFLHRQTGFRFGRPFLVTLGKTLLASAIMGFGLTWGRDMFCHPGLSTLKLSLILPAIMLGGMVLYLLAVWVLRVAELKELQRMIKRAP
ncbi:MAG: murein biosynthesis integral membrane protein MurJ [Magnetococcales bacterium]|nr:murein biosynthesis integral membrane protein MurJ [Magnetococcales bacterium]